MVLQLPEMDRVITHRDIIYKTVGDLSLKADIYLPAGTPPGSRLPAVLLVHGDAPWEILLDAKEWGQYRSWGELFAAFGLAAVAFTHRSSERLARPEQPVSDVIDLIAYVRQNAAELQIDSDRLGLWACSAGGPAGLTPVLTGQAGALRCAAALYPLLEIGPGRVPPGADPDSLRPYSPLAALEASQGQVPPLLVVRAGQDHPDFTQSADRFAAAALARNADLELINYPGGHHGFELRDDEERSRQIIRRVAAFFRQHLA